MGVVGEIPQCVVGVVGGPCKDVVEAEAARHAKRAQQRRRLHPAHTFQVGTPCSGNGSKDRAFCYEHPWAMILYGK